MDPIRIAQVRCNRDIFDVILTDKYARCLLNGMDVIGSKDLVSFAPIVAMLVASSCTVPGTAVAIKKDPSFGDFLKGLVDTLSKSDQIKVQVLEDKPDEKDNQKPKQASKLTVEELDGYRCGVRAYCDCFNDVLSLSEILLKTKLPKSVLAFKDLSSSLSRVRTATIELNKNRDHCDIVVEHTGNHIGRVMVAMENNPKDPSIKKIIQESVDHVVADFMGTKKFLASLINSHYPLYDINPLFKKHTDYPATWFFDPSVFYNFTERYKDASDSLIEVARTEDTVIRPLYALAN
jgi:hypothetical protein